MAIALAVGGVVSMLARPAEAHHFYDVWLEADGSLLYAMRRALSEPSHFSGLVATVGIATGLFLFFARRAQNPRVKQTAQVFTVVAILTIAASGFVAFAP
ncbi:MAG: hypothetical protein OD811_05660 [Alphaproteobacteria bacterium]